MSYKTPEEQNYDMGSIVNCYGSWRQPNWDDMSTSDLDNGMTYTINHDAPYCSEFGSIAFKPMFGGLIRIG